MKPGSAHGRGSWRARGAQSRPHCAARHHVPWVHPHGVVSRMPATFRQPQDQECIPHPAAMADLATVNRLDSQGWTTVLAGALLALITLFTSYSHVSLPIVGDVTLHQQTGVPLIAASLATLVVDTQLASRRRSRDQRNRVRAADQAAEERERADRERERTARRAQRQDRCNLVQLRHQLNPSAANCRAVANLIALLEDYSDVA